MLTCVSGLLLWPGVDFWLWAKFLWQTIIYASSVEVIGCPASSLRRRATWGREASYQSCPTTSFSERKGWHPAERLFRQGRLESSISHRRQTFFFQRSSSICALGSSSIFGASSINLVESGQVACFVREHQGWKGHFYSRFYEASRYFHSLTGRLSYST